MSAASAKRVLYASAFVRATATGTAGVTLGAFLGKRCSRSRKIAYDVMLWRAFRGLKPPEEHV